MITRVLFTLTLLFSLTFVKAQTTIEVGVLSDIDNQESLTSFLNKLTEEIRRTIGSDYSLSLMEENILIGINGVLESKSNYTVLAEKGLDLILVLGPQSISGLTNKKSFEVPTLAIGILDDQLQSLPKNDLGATGVHNFTYIQSTTTLAQSIIKFKSYYDFKHITLLTQMGLVEILDKELAKKKLHEIESQLNIRIETVPISNESVNKLSFSDSTDAVFLLLDFQFPKEILTEIASILEANNLASFSSTQEHINKGILFSYGDDRTQFLRKIALTVDEMLEGRRFAEMPVDIELNQKIYLNLSTARKIKFPLTYQTVFTSNIIENEDISVPYEILNLLEKALNENLSYKVSQQDLLSSELEVKQALSNYYPNLDLAGTYNELSENQINDFSFQAQRTLSANLSFNQVIFSESVLANIRINQYLLKAQKYNTQQDLLNVLFDTYMAYFEILQRKASLKIQKENLEVSKTNLELSKIQNKVGSKDNTDLYRFQGELATNTQYVIEANGNLIISKLNLNRLLNNTLRQEFEVSESDLESAIFQYYLNHPIANFIKSPMHTAKLTDFLVQEALNKNPSKNALDANKQLLERQLKLNKRMFYTPTLTASGSYTNNLYRGGTGSEAVEGFIIPNNTWNVTGSLIYPIFDGTRRKLDKQQTLISLDQIQLNMADFNQNIRLAIQSNLISLFMAYTDLDYSKQSQINQEKNFEINQNKYRVGQVSIVQLLDAQSALLLAKETYALSIYTFIQTFLQLEYNIGHFSQLSAPAELQDFEKRLNEFLID